MDRKSKSINLHRDVYESLKQFGATETANNFGIKLETVFRYARYAKEHMTKSEKGISTKVAKVGYITITAAASIPLYYF